ncbi:hypothetical protein [Streptomyces sp. NBC_00459]|uniref:hypothetical protein n=1 Tax=Streptomyces sp. NBC_00459 TaxID=2975749 RepID=UPI002E1937A6
MPLLALLEQHTPPTRSELRAPASGIPAAITTDVTRTTQASTASERRLSGLRRHRHHLTLMPMADTSLRSRRYE